MELKDSEEEEKNTGYLAFIYLFSLATNTKEKEQDSIVTFDERLMGI